MTETLPSWLGAGGSDPLYDALFFIVMATLWVVVLLRLGVLVTVVVGTLSLCLHEWLPMTLDFSTWYVGATLLAFAVAIGLAVYGFHASLGGGPVLGDRALDG